jgi:molecular chaperone GrpE
MTKNKKEELDENQELVAEANEVAEEIEEALASSDEIIEALQSDLAEARSKADEYLDGWQRSRAEFTNYKKRIERDQSQTYQVAAGNVIRRFLSVVDDLERALNKLVSILENEGITPIQAEGEMFDPNFHEAIMSDESDSHESGRVIEVMQQGYMLGDKVLRPAMVRVAK